MYLRESDILFVSRGILSAFGRMYYLEGRVHGGKSAWTTDIHTHPHYFAYIRRGGILDFEGGQVYEDMNIVYISMPLRR